MNTHEESSALRRTPLYDWHTKRGARLVPFAGWQMPLQYEGLGPIEEHHLVRSGAGLFDVSHMGRFEVTGEDAAGFLDSALTANMGGMEESQSRYSLLCGEDGGILDDVFVYRLSRDKFLVVVNASNRDRDFDVLSRRRESFNAKLSDVSSQSAMIALQGPLALEILRSASGGSFVPPERFFFTSCTLEKTECLIARTGYTGEDGVEIFLPAERAALVCDRLLSCEGPGGKAGPAGLAARDSLRFEAGFPLYGHELTSEVTPVEASLLWACDLSKPFTGKVSIAARKAAGPQKKLVTFVMREKAVAREGYSVLDEGGSPVGVVASGMFAPTAGVFAGNAFVPVSCASLGKALYVEVRGEAKLAEVVKRPLYMPVYRR